jgi:hypothetical protein
VGGGPLVAGQTIDDGAGTAAESEFWASTIEAEGIAKTKRSKILVTPRVYNRGYHY